MKIDLSIHIQICISTYYNTLNWHPPKLQLLEWWLKAPKVILIPIETYIKILNFMAVIEGYRVMKNGFGHYFLIANIWKLYSGHIFMAYNSLV